jgi:hypothetical protein
MSKSFLVWLLIVAAAFTSGYAILLPHLSFKTAYLHYIYIVIFFIVSTAAFHFGLSKSAASGSKQMIRYYMMATGFKILIYITIIILYAIINKPGIMPFAFCFLLCYCVFTVFEVSFAFHEFGTANQKKDSI